jgi:hypothetical protein
VRYPFTLQASPLSFPGVSPRFNSRPLVLLREVVFIDCARSPTEGAVSHSYTGALPRLTLFP